MPRIINTFKKKEESNDETSSRPRREASEGLTTEGRSRRQSPPKLFINCFLYKRIYPSRSPFTPH